MRTSKLGKRMADTVAAKYDYKVEERDGHVEITVRTPRIGLAVFLGIVATILSFIEFWHNIGVALLISIIAGVGIWRLSRLAASSKIVVGPDTITAANRSFAIKDIQKVHWDAYSEGVVLKYGTDDIRIAKIPKLNTGTAVVDAIIRALNRYGHRFNVLGFR